MKKLLLLFTAMLLSACAGFTCAPSAGSATTGSSSRGAGVTNVDLAHSRYDFVSFNDMEIKPLGDSDLKQPRIEFNDTMRASGRLCNNFSGQAAINNNTLKAPVLGSTMMMCPDGNLMRAERAFFRALTDGATISKSGDMLNIRHGDNLFVLKRHNYKR